MRLLYIAEFRKEVCNVFFRRFFMYISNQNNPPFDRYNPSACVLLQGV
jgi:hypothetical protein